MKETMKRVFALVLSFVMIFTSLPVMQASAEVNPTVLSLGTAYSGNFEVKVGESFQLQFKGQGPTRLAGPSNFNKNSVLGFDGAFELHYKPSVYTFTALKAGQYVFTTKGNINTYSWTINVKPSVYYVDILYYFNGQLLETISNVEIEDFDIKTIDEQVTEVSNYDSDHYSYNATLSNDNTKVIVTITQTAFDYSFAFVDEEENGVSLSCAPLTMVSNLVDDDVKAAIDETLEGTDYEFVSYSVEDEVITVVVKKIVLPEEPTVDYDFYKEYTINPGQYTYYVNYVLFVGNRRFRELYFGNISILEGEDVIKEDWYLDHSEIKGVKPGVAIFKESFLIRNPRYYKVTVLGETPVDEPEQPEKYEVTVKYFCNGQSLEIDETAIVDELTEEKLTQYNVVPEELVGEYLFDSAKLEGTTYTVNLKEIEFRYEYTIFVGEYGDKELYGTNEIISGEGVISFHDAKGKFGDCQKFYGEKEGVCVFTKTKSETDIAYIKVTVLDTKVTVNYVCGDKTLKTISDIKVREITEDALKEYNKVPEEFAVGYTLGEAKLEGNVYTVNLNERVFDYTATIKVGERYTHKLSGDITVLSGEGVLSFYDETKGYGWNADKYKYAVGEKVGVCIFKKVKGNETKYFMITVEDTEVTVKNYLSFLWNGKTEKEFISNSKANLSELTNAWYEAEENHIEGYDWNGTYDAKLKENYYRAKKVVVNKTYGENFRNPITTSKIYNYLDKKVDFENITDWNKSGLYPLTEEVWGRTYTVDLDSVRVDTIAETYIVINVHYTEKAQELKYEYTLPNGLINNGGKVFKKFVINKAEDIAENIEEVVEKDYMAAAKAAGEEVIEMSKKDGEIAEAILDGTAEDIENGFVVTTDKIDSSFAKYKLVVTFTYGEALTAKFDGTLTNAKKEQVEQQAKNIAHDAVRDAFYSYDDDMEFVEEEVKDSLGNGTLAAGNNEVEVTLVTKDGDMFLVKATVSTSKSGKSKNKKKTTKIDEEVPQGLINGINDLRNNRPNDNITRSEFVGVLAEIFTVLDSGSYKPFEDIAGCKSENEIKKFSGCGIVKGYCDEVFGTNDCLTREQMYLILARAIKFSGKATSLSEEEVTAKLATILGGTEVSEWASEGVAIAIEKGLVDEENVDPQGFITRALTADKLEKFIAVITTTEEEVK